MSAAANLLQWLIAVGFRGRDGGALPSPVPSTVPSIPVPGGETMRPMSPTRIDTPLLRRMNERRMFDAVLVGGPLSRKAVGRATGMAAPTVTKTADSLLERGMLEEYADSPSAPRKAGRPVRLLRLAATRSTVLGIVVDARHCTVVAAGIDGRHREEQTVRFTTPSTYRDVIAGLVKACRTLIRTGDVAPLGVGISMPGLVDSAQAKVLFSPNLHILDGRSPAADLEGRLGIGCRMFQESHALCLGESMFGAARGLADFALLDVSTGLGLGVMSGGRLLTGSTGLAGEIGHLRIDPRGPRCGCGNRGCLDTLATDSALARRVSERLGRRLGVDDVIAGVRSGRIDATDALDATIDHLAVAVGAVVNIFNPATLFVHGALLSAAHDAFTRLLDRLPGAVLKPSYAACTIVRARGSKRTGAVAGIVDHVTAGLFPRLEAGS